MHTTATVYRFYTPFLDIDIYLKLDFYKNEI